MKIKIARGSILTILGLSAIFAGCNIQDESSIPQTVAAASVEAAKPALPPVATMHWNMSDEDKAIQILNHLAGILYRVKKAENKCVLEVEYEKLTADNLFLDVIKDQESVEYINSLRSYILSDILTKTEQERLQQWLKDDLRMSIFAAVPPVPSVESFKTLPVALDTSFDWVHNWFSGYMNLRMQLIRENREKRWQLTKNQKLRLNKFYGEQIEKIIALLTKYHQEDYLRVTTKELDEFYSQLEKSVGTDAHSRYDWIISRCDKYQKVPEYWYRRALTEEALGKTTEAIASYQEFQKIYLQLFRHDQMAADVAVNLTMLLLKTGKYTSREIQNQLEIIKGNVDSRSWEYYYFLGTVYTGIGMYDEAVTEFGVAIHDLQGSAGTEYGKLTEKGKGGNFFKKYCAYSEDLMHCRKAYFNAKVKSGNFSAEVIGKEFSNIYINDIISGYEIISYQTENNHLLQALPEELFRTFCQVSISTNGKVKYLLPYSWFYLGNDKVDEDGKSCIDLNEKWKKIREQFVPCSLLVVYTGKGQEEFTENLNNRKLQFQGNDPMVSVQFPFKYKPNAKKKNRGEIKRLEFTLPLRDVNITWVFVPAASRETLYLSEIRLNKGDALKMDENMSSTGSNQALGKAIEAYFAK